MSQEKEKDSEKFIPPAGPDPESISRRAFVGTVAAAGATALAGSAVGGPQKAAENRPCGRALLDRRLVRASSAA